MSLTHNSTVAKSEPAWSAVDKTKLPRNAFADQGKADEKSTWKYPHHWVSGGTMYLHRGGLNAAWSAAQGGRSGQKASPAVIAHLQVHRKALGLDQKQSMELIPAAAFCLAVGPCEFILAETPGDGTVPVRVKARTGQPVDHWLFGRMVHDMRGMSAKPTIPLDYIHDDTQIIGFGRATAADHGVTVDGTIVPFAPGDRASEILFKARAGVPYEASIDWRGPSQMQWIADGESASVNGYQFKGPGVIVRKWTLRGMAICPHGMDQNTKVQFTEGDRVPVTFLDAAPKPQGGNPMAEDQDTEVETEATPERPVEPQDAVPATPVAPPIAPPAAGVMTRSEVIAEGKRFLENFGEAGGKWFAEGLSFDEARNRHATQLSGRIKALEGENAELKGRLAAVGGGLAAPIGGGMSEEARPGTDPEAAKKAARAEKAAKLAPTVGEGVAAFAAGLELPGKK